MNFIKSIPVVGNVLDWFTGRVVGFAKDAMSSALEALTKWVTDTLKQLVLWVLQTMRETTEVRLADAFSHDPQLWKTLLGIAALLLLGAVCAAVLQGVMRGEPGAMVRRVAVGLPTSVLAMVVIIPVTDRLLVATDELTDNLLSPANKSINHLFDITGTIAAVPGMGFLAFVLGVFGVFAALGVWLELFARSALIYVLVAMSPIAFALTVWPSLRRVAHRLVHVLIALLLAKPLIAVVIRVGATVMMAANASTSFAKGAGTAIIALFVLILAVFAPYGLLRLLPMTEAALAAQGASAVPLGAVSGAMGSVGLGVGSELTRLAYGPSAGGSSTPGAGSSGTPGASSSGAPSSGSSASLASTPTGGAGAGAGASTGAGGAAGGAAGVAGGVAAAVAIPLAVVGAGTQAGRGAARGARQAGDAMSGAQ